MEVRFIGEIEDLVVGETGAGTLTFPMKTGDSTAPKIAGTVVITGWQPGTVDNEGRLTGTLSVTPDSQTEWTYTAGS